MEAVDGNALAGPLFAHFGREMTADVGACASCGAISQIAELRVYDKAPGRVVRCRSCGSIVMVLVEIRGETRVHLDGFRLTSPGAETS
jgi:DNA-directed RNA polymerase subunit RPC12/RpoP